MDEANSIVLSTPQQLGKLTIATVVGFAASKGAEKLFDLAVECYRRKKHTITK
ncbi:MAG: hypothetical protein ABWY25_07495 [Paenisporosarcina sp.]